MPTRAVCPGECACRLGLSVLQSVHAVLEEVSHSCNRWTQLSDSVEQQVSGLHDRVEVLLVTALAQKQKGDASKPALAVLERSMADLQAQLAAEKKSHQLTQVLIALAPHIQPTCLGLVREVWQGWWCKDFGNNIVAVCNSCAAILQSLALAQGGCEFAQGSGVGFWVCALTQQQAPCCA